MGAAAVAESARGHPAAGRNWQLTASEVGRVRRSAIPTVTAFWGRRLFASGSRMPVARRCSMSARRQLALNGLARQRADASGEASHASPSPELSHRPLFMPHGQRRPLRTRAQTLRAPTPIGRGGREGCLPQQYIGPGVLRRCQAPRWRRRLTIFQGGSGKWSAPLRPPASTGVVGRRGTLGHPDPAGRRAVTSHLTEAIDRAALSCRSAARARSFALFRIA